MVPMLSPDGKVGDVPNERVRDAMKAGFKPGVELIAPNGQRGVIPIERASDALKSGFTIDREALHNNEQALANSYGHAFGFAAGGGLQNLAAEAVPGMLETAKSIIQGLAKRVPQSEVAADIVGVISPRAANALRTAQRAAKVLTPAEEAAPAAAEAAKPAAEAAAVPKGAPVYRDATLNKRNIPEFAGEEEPVAQTPKPKQVRGAAARDAKAMQQASALKQQTDSIVDNAIPDNHAANLRTKAQIDFHLKQGNVDAAQQLLDKAKTPDFQPPQARGNTHDIRHMQPEAQARRFADLQDDASIQQQMRANLDAHGRLAESDARKEFIARNSTGTMKEELVRGAGGQAEGPTRFSADEAAYPKKVAAPQPRAELEADIQRQSDLLRKSGASEKAIQRTRNDRLYTWNQQVARWKAANPGKLLPGVQ